MPMHAPRCYSRLSTDVKLILGQILEKVVCVGTTGAKLG